MNKPAFYEEYVSPHQDPLSPTHADFDFDAVARSLGEIIPSDNDPEEASDITPELVRAFKRIFEFCLNIDINKKVATELVGRRLMALAWVINPSLFEDSPSIRELNRRLGFQGSTMRMLTGEASRAFGIRNRAQGHAWNYDPNNAPKSVPACLGVCNTQKYKNPSR
jgi:hypothetical protein